MKLQVQPLLLLCLTTLTLIAFSGNAYAQQNDRPEIHQIFETILSAPKLEGSTFSSFELVLKPGFVNEVEHRHNGDLIGYVLEGEIEIVMDDSKKIIYKKGEFFHEKHQQLHASYVNPSSSDTTKVLMINLLKKDL